MEGGDRIRQRKKFNCNKDSKHFLANCVMASKKIGYKTEFILAPRKISFSEHAFKFQGKTQYYIENITFWYKKNI